MFIFFVSLFSCERIGEGKCISSKNRIKSIHDQREVLRDLRKMDRIEKKKFKAIDNILIEEENIEIQRFANYCK